MYLTALFILMSTEYGPFAITVALLTWALLNFLWLIVLRRPGVAAALSLALVAMLIGLSQFKYGITQLTLTFLDFLIIDRDTFSFLQSIFPQLRTKSIALAVIAVPLMWLVWRADPFRIRRVVSAAGASACVVLIAALSVAFPEQPWEPFQGVNHISSLARSGVVSVWHLTSTGWIEADPRIVNPVRAAPQTACAPRARRPFRTPLVWFTAPAGVFMCLFMMVFLPFDTWLRLVVWTIIGLAIYFLYSVHHARPSRWTIAEGPAE